MTNTNNNQSQATSENDTPAQPQPETQNQSPKTISLRKLAANRANALKSHGPTTPAGLAKCASAAAQQLTHGLRAASSVVIQGESHSGYLDLVNRLILTFHPKSEAQLEAVHDMAAAIWRKRRARAFQAMDLNAEMASLDPTEASAPAALRAYYAFLASLHASNNPQSVAHRYETTYIRQYRQALASFSELRSLQHKSSNLNDIDPTFLVTGNNWEDPAV